MKKKKSLVGWADTQWKERFKFFTRRRNRTKENEWIDALRHSELKVPLIYRNKRPMQGCVHPYPFCNKKKRVRITIEEI